MTPASSPASPAPADPLAPPENYGRKPWLEPLWPDVRECVHVSANGLGQLGQLCGRPATWRVWMCCPREHVFPVSYCDEHRSWIVASGRRIECQATTHEGKRVCLATMKIGRQEKIDEPH